jgi:transketolase
MSMKKIININLEKILLYQKEVIFNSFTRINIRSNKVIIKSLKKFKISAELVNIVSLKPIDESINKLLSKYKKIITIEEHTKVGGLGSIIAEKILKNKINSQLYSFSLPDKFGPTAKYDHLLKYHGLDAEWNNKKNN